MPKDLTPQKIFYMLLRHVKLILLITALVTLIAYGYSSFFITPVYSASSLILVQSYNEDVTPKSTKYYQATQPGRVAVSDIQQSASLASSCVILFENMPDHFFDIQKRSIAARYQPVPKFSVSLELGYRFPLQARVRHTQLSLAVALFADYGMLFIGDNATNISAVTYPNDPVKPEFYPYANPFLYRGVENSTVDNLMVGIKFTFLLSSSRSYPCFCL